jgi:FkbM family methyltransferase
MNKDHLGDYYIHHQVEFLGEAGHQKLLDGLKRHIPKEPDTSKIVAIDVGACVGNYVENLFGICKEPDTRILCFEPNPTNLLALEMNVRKYPNVKVFAQGVSNETSRLAFYNFKDHGNHTGNEIAGLRGGGEKICDVDVVTLDSVLDSEYTGEDITIKFLKIDTEGNDGNVIKGCAKYLSKTKYIIFECSNCLDDFRGPGIPNPMKDIVDFLSKHGFDTYRIGTQKLFKVNDEFWNPVYDEVKFWSNCFALKKNDPLIHRLVDANFDYFF